MRGLGLARRRTRRIPYRRGRPAAVARLVPHAGDGAHLAVGLAGARLRGSRLRSVRWADEQPRARVAMPNGLDARDEMQPLEHECAHLDSRVRVGVPPVIDAGAYFKYCKVQGARCDGD